MVFISIFALSLLLFYTGKARIIASIITNSIASSRKFQKYSIVFHPSQYDWVNIPVSQIYIALFYNMFHDNYLMKSGPPKFCSQKVNRFHGLRSRKIKFSSTSLVFSHLMMYKNRKDMQKVVYVWTQEYQPVL